MVEKCNLCGNLKVFKHLGRFVCNGCFVTLIEKRVKKSLSKAFVKGERVLVVGSLAGYFMGRVNVPLEIVNEKGDKIVLELTMDDVDAGFLSGFFGKDFKIDKDEKVVRILQSITDEEALRFAKLKGLEFKVSDKDKVIKDFLKKISLKHAEVRFNLLKNVKEVERVLG
ncbi:MAG: hypothetical protein KAT77_06125 [Nanoarchaeota archaeon]|nr:hypothetical protein [Nanoarchaeota archaeon]